jgi:hypothetical protein
MGDTYYGALGAPYPYTPTSHNYNPHIVATATLLFCIFLPQNLTVGCCPGQAHLYTSSLSFGCSSPNAQKRSFILGISNVPIHPTEHPEGCIILPTLNLSHLFQGALPHWLCSNLTLLSVFPWDLISSLPLQCLEPSYDTSIWQTLTRSLCHIPAIYCATARHQTLGPWETCTQSSDLQTLSWKKLSSVPGLHFPKDCLLSAPSST